jgi:hypothetical protein
MAFNGRELNLPLDPRCSFAKSKPARGLPSRQAGNPRQPVARVVSVAC